MKAFRVLFSAYFGFLIYILCTFLWGQAGIFAYSDLLEYKHQLESNIVELEGISINLQDEMYNLRFSPETITLRARQLCYVENNQQFIRINTQPLQRESYYNIGTILHRNGQRENLVPVFRGMALSITLAVYLLSGVFFKRH